MSDALDAASIEPQVAQWRSFLRQRRAIHAVDIAELEDHLREQVGSLTEAGLAADEAFIVAVKRMGALDALSREFAREHSERLWKQLVVSAPDNEEAWGGARRGAFVAFGSALAAAIAVKLPTLFGMQLETDAAFFARNAGLFVLPFLVGYFAWKRQLGVERWRWPAAMLVAGALFANVYPTVPGGHVELLAVLHLPIALWLAVGIAYAGQRWGDVAGRMDFIRFSGELFIYFVLIALGGGVLTAFLLMMFETVGLSAEWFVQNWLLPCGAAGAVVIAAWLVEAKQSVIENMAPVLTRLFTPMFAGVLLAFLGVLLLGGRGASIERDMLIAFDVLLVLVLALLVYSVSARDPAAPADAFDAMQIALVLSALLADAIALWAIADRIGEYGFSPNRVAVLGVNLVLLVNLTWSAVLYIRFMRGHCTFGLLERWQTAYLPVYAGWAAVVVILFPPLFGYV